MSYEVYRDENTLKYRIGYNVPSTLRLTNKDQFKAGVVVNFVRSDNDVVPFWWMQEG